MKASSYVEQRRKNYWRENSLAYADEDISKKFDWKLLRQFLPYMKDYRLRLIASTVLMLIYTVANLLNPYLIGLAIDDFITQRDLKGLAVISGILLAVNVIMWLAQYGQVWTMSWTGEQILYRLSSDMFAHLQELSLRFYDRTQIGRVMSRLQSDMDVLESMLNTGLLSILSSLISLVGIIVAMLSMNVPLALLTFAVLPIMMVIAAFWQRHAQRSRSEEHTSEL